MGQNKILLLGGSGFVGNQVASQLAVGGFNVLVPTRRRNTTLPLGMVPNIKVVCANIHDVKVLGDLMQGVSAVINLAGILHDRDSRYPFGKNFSAVHVGLPEKIIAAMKLAGTRRLVHMSAMCAALNAPSEYLRSKAAGEQIVLVSGLDVTVFRPSIIFGRDDACLNAFAKLIKLFKIIWVFRSKTRFQPVYVGDVAKVIMACLNDPMTFSQIYELGGPKIYSMKELHEYLGALMGKTPLLIDLPASAEEWLATILGYLPKPPISPDNLRTMMLDNVTDGWRNYPSWDPVALEAILPGYLSVAHPRLRFSGYRFRAGR